MAMLHEDLIYKYLNTINKKLLQMQRVETTINDGVPDIFFSTNNTSGWIESKRLMWPNDEYAKVKIPFRPGQYAWLNRFRSKGCNVKLLVLICTGQHTGRVFVFSNDNIQQHYCNINEFIRLASYSFDLVNTELLHLNILKALDQ